MENNNQQNNVEKKEEIKQICCPKCGGTNLQAVSDTTGKGVKCWKVFCFGLLGLCGAGKTKTEHYWVCANCGNKFKI